jgi:hypothetical protein
MRKPDQRVTGPDYGYGCGVAACGGGSDRDQRWPKTALTPSSAATNASRRLSWLPGNAVSGRAGPLRQSARTPVAWNTRRSSRRPRSPPGQLPVPSPWPGQAPPAVLQAPLDGSREDQAPPTTAAKYKVVLTGRGRAQGRWGVLRKMHPSNALPPGPSAACYAPSGWRPSPGHLHPPAACLAAVTVASRDPGVLLIEFSLIPHGA